MAVKEMASISTELMVFTRNNITDPQTRPTSQTDNFTGDASRTNFILTKQGVKNVKTVTIDAVSKSFGTDYTVTYGASETTIVFGTAPGNSTAVQIIYDYGDTWIYDDLPRNDLQIGSYPRIAVRITKTDIEEIGLGGVVTQTTITTEWKVLSTDEKEVLDLLTDIKSAIISNKKSFYNFDFITPVSTSEITASTGRNAEIVEGTLTCEIPFIFEQ